MESLTIYKSPGYAGCQTNEDPGVPMVLLILGKLDEIKGINVPFGCFSSQPVAKLRFELKIAMKVWKFTVFENHQKMSHIFALKMAEIAFLSLMSIFGAKIQIF